MEKLKRTDERESYCLRGETGSYPAFTRRVAGSNPAGGTELTFRGQSIYEVWARGVTGSMPGSYPGR